MRKFLFILAFAPGILAAQFSGFESVPKRAARFNNNKLAAFAGNPSNFFDTTTAVFIATSISPDSIWQLNHSAFYFCRSNNQFPHIYIGGFISGNMVGDTKFFDSTGSTIKINLPYTQNDSLKVGFLSSVFFNVAGGGVSDSSISILRGTKRVGVLGTLGSLKNVDSMYIGGNNALHKTSVPALGSVRWYGTIGETNIVLSFKFPLATDTELYRRLLLQPRNVRAYYRGIGTSHGWYDWRSGGRDKSAYHNDLNAINGAFVTCSSLIRAL